MKIINTGSGIQVFPNLPDEFFDDWLKQGNVNHFGIDKKGFRYVVIYEDVFYCLEDVAKYIKNWKTRNYTLYDYIHSICPFISASQAKDLYKIMPNAYKVGGQEGD